MTVAGPLAYVFTEHYEDVMIIIVKTYVLRENYFTTWRRVYTQKLIYFINE